MYKKLIFKNVDIRIMAFLWCTEHLGVDTLHKTVTAISCYLGKEY